MRLYGESEPAYEPNNEAERAICKAVEAFTGQEVMTLWTQDTYPYEEENGKQIQMEHDYIAETGVRNKPGGMFIGGVEVGVSLHDGEITLEELGIWT